jgi:oligopeptide/dipeptide ABC transporter ATP-binding protein
MFSELSQKKELFARPRHPYRRALISAAPITHPRLRMEKNIIEGKPPSLLNIPWGCTFHARCPFAREICLTERPPLQEIATGHWVSCHRADEF